MMVVVRLIEEGKEKLLASFFSKLVSSKLCFKMSTYDKLIVINLITNLKIVTLGILSNSSYLLLLYNQPKS